MSEQNIKVGDRGRATLDESVIVGTVMWLGEGGMWVRVGGLGDYRYFLHAAWTVEVLPPPIPDVVGTIVRDADGDAWQRASSGWLVISEDGDYSLNHVQKNYGPLTVLWTPEATS